MRHPGPAGLALLGCAVAVVAADSAYRFRISASSSDGTSVGKPTKLKTH